MTTTIKTIKQAQAITGGLSNPSKMPGFGYNLPATACKIGSKLRNVAGSVCEKCYALKGRYCFPVVKNAMAKRLDAINSPLWVEAMAFQINHYAKKGHKFFRWHDSGDLQSPEHLRKIYEVCKLTPDVKHWLPTREYAFVRKAGSPPANLTIRLSAYMVGQTVSNGLTKSLGVVSSAVLPKGQAKSIAGSHVCHATTTDVHECRNCRACWDKGVSTVVYAKH